MTGVKKEGPTILSCCQPIGQYLFNTLMLAFSVGLISKPARHRV